MIVNLEHPSGLIKQVKVGFSWTIFFFGGFPFLFRRMPLHFCICLIGSFFTFGMVAFIFAFIGNKQTAVHFLEKGYKQSGSGWNVASSKWNMAAKSE